VPDRAWLLAHAEAPSAAALKAASLKTAGLIAWGVGALAMEVLQALVRDRANVQTYKEGVHSKTCHGLAMKAIS
jgi:hypothetical protein